MDLIAKVADWFGLRSKRSPRYKWCRILVKFWWVIRGSSRRRRFISHDNDIELNACEKESWSTKQGNLPQAMKIC